MRRIRLVLEYDGTDFAGYQAQGKGERTVQATLEEALGQISGHPVIAHGAGRTDSGVHARGQVVHFDLSGRIPTDRIVTALNGNLPRDIAVRSASEVTQDFHARFSAKQRTYAYLLWREPSRSALWGRYTWWEPANLDIREMRDAASLLVGIRDFGAFANAGGDPGSTLVRHVKRLEVRPMPGGSILAIRVTANAFLRSMVRNLVGALVSVGKRELTPQELEEIAGHGRREQNPCATAPPQGLCLMRVDY